MLIINEIKKNKVKKYVSDPPGHLVCTHLNLVKMYKIMNS